MTPEFYERLGIHASGAMRTALSPTERKIERQLDEFASRVRADVAPFADGSRAGVRARYDETADTEAFGRVYTPHYCTAPADPFHRDVDALVDGYTPDGHPDGSDGRPREAYVWPMHGPREHAKSIRCRIGLLKRVLRGTLHYPLVLSEHLYIAQAHLDYLLVDLTANVRISADFDVDVLVRDRADGVLRLRVTPRATGVAHDIQLDAASYGRPVKGRVFMQYRPDFVLIDDFESTRGARNREISHQKASWVLQEVYPAVVGPIVWLGNVGHDTSALFKAICDAEGSEAKGKALMRRGSRPGAIAHAAGLIPAEAMGRPSPLPEPDRTADDEALPSQGGGGETRPPERLSDDAPDADDDWGVPPPTPASRTPSDGPGGEIDLDLDDDDLYAGIEGDDEPVEAAITALVYRAERLVVGDGGELQTEYLWPSRYPRAWYRRKALTMGPFRYEGEFNGFPSREGDVFKREWLDAATYTDADLERAMASPKWRVFSWLDPAFGKSGTSCDKVVVVVGTDGSDFFVLGAYVRNDEPTSACLDAWRDFFVRFDRHGLRHGQYENDFGQDDRLALDLDMATERHGFRLPVSGDSNRRGDKDARIESMQPVASTYHLRFPADGERLRTPDVERLFNQLLAYPSGNVDGPDALESAVARLRRGAAGELEYTALQTRRYARGGRRTGTGARPSPSRRR